MTNPLECRKSIRIKIALHLTHIKAGANGEKISGFSKDLSSGGIMFSSSVEYKLEDIVHLEIKLYNTEDKENVIVLSAKVLRVQKLDKDMYSISACFIWTDIKHRKVLEEFINKQAKGRKSFFN